MCKTSVVLLATTDTILLDISTSSKFPKILQNAGMKIINKGTQEDLPSVAQDFENGSVGPHDGTLPLIYEKDHIDYVV